MMKKVILTIGAPGAGKSTWAQEQAKNSKTFIVCRDDLRQMMFGGEYKYSREKEQAVTFHVKQALEQFLEQDHFETMIIADTNLNESTRNGYKKIVDTKNDRILKSGYKIPSIKFEEKPFDESWNVLFSRNLKRGNKAVPIDVLRSMHLNMQKYLGKHKHYEPDTTKPKAIIVDLDGTIANNNHRGAFQYDKLIDDKPIEKILDLVKMYEKSGHEIICVSGRNAGNAEDNRKFHTLTKEWLDKHKVPWYQLIMREWNDYRKDDIIKEEIFWNRIASNYNVVAALDDRAQVVEMWRRIGVTCLQVAHGDF